MRLLTTLTLFLLVALQSQAQTSSYWQSVQEQNLDKSQFTRRDIVPQKYQTFALDLTTLQAILKQAPLRFSGEEDNRKVEITLPMPEGNLERFEIVYTPVMEDALAGRYPEIRTYAGVGIDDPNAQIRFDVTQRGLHGMILSPLHSVFIEPYGDGNTKFYIAYHRKDNVTANEATCLNKDDVEAIHASNTGSFRTNDGKLRKYRAAIACTGEYATYHGGTKALALAAMNTSLNRVNGVLEKEIGVTMTLIANNDKLLYLDAANDPYTNDQAGTMLNENQTNCNAVVGATSYDIGHVFSTYGGGIAQLNSPCTAGKARGTTGSFAPKGDKFDIGLVSHEMGHQYGASHTFSIYGPGTGYCDAQISVSTAMEPASGTTIMSYAGICGTGNNVLQSSEPYYHAISIDQMNNNTISGQSSTCPTLVNANNAVPTVSAGIDGVIPKSTSFEMIGVANDANAADNLTYNWDEIDAGSTGGPPVSTLTTAPLFRSYIPTTSKVRTVPNITDLLANTTSQWEVLPTVARSLNFRFIVRDNHVGGGATTVDDMKITVASNSGPFLLVQPNVASTTWNIGSTQTVKWDVANTTAAPVSCSKVDIFLSKDGGLTYPVTVAAGLPNTGTADVVVPDAASTKARLKVKGANNVFFDISDANFTVQVPPTPTVLLTTNPTNYRICNNYGNVVYPLGLTSIAGFAETVELTVIGLPTNATGVFSANNFNPATTSNVTYTVGNVQNIPSGNYTITITAKTATVTRVASFTMQVTNGLPAVSSITTPTYDAKNVSAIGPLSWKKVVNTEKYFIQISNNILFTDIADTATVVKDTFYSPKNMMFSNVYYWRVKSINDCGQSAFSPISIYQVVNSVCSDYVSTNIGQTISASAATTTTSTVNVPTSGVIGSVQLYTKITHTFVDDLEIYLKNPAGKEILLFDPTCTAIPVISIDATFKDEGVPFNCGGTVIGGVKSLSPLRANFGGVDPKGTWTLSVKDNTTTDGGILNKWTLKVCTETPNTDKFKLQNKLLPVELKEFKNIDTSFLSAELGTTQPVLIFFTVLTLPKHGKLILDTTTLKVGSKFTENDMLDYLLNYENNGDIASTDDFTFSVWNSNGAWTGTQKFNIKVNAGVVVTVDALGQNPTCNALGNGKITITASGGATPYSYTLNNGTAQASNVFSNLVAGTYTVTAKDANGVIGTQTNITLTNPPALNVTATATDNTITATATGGTGTLSYSINNGTTFQASNIFINVPNGSYNVLVKDANNCPGMSATLTVLVNTLVVSAVKLNDISCNNANDGKISITVSGGKAPFTYNLSNGTFQTNSTIKNLAAGTYTITVIDADGLKKVTNSITITNPPLITISATAKKDTIIATAAGGTGALSFSNNSGTSFQASPTFLGVVNGTYTIIAKDANSCTVTSNSVTVFVNTLAATAAKTNDISCNNANDGKITVTTSGGKAPLTYSLNNAAFQANNVFSNLAAGNYIVTVKDADGITKATSSITITNPSAIVANASIAGTTATINASGGTGAFTYSLDNGAFGATNIFANLKNKSYIVTVKDANGCTTTVNVKPESTLSAAVTGINLKCFGDKTGTATAVGSGGTTPYTYVWSNNATTATISSLDAGTYQVTIVDAAGFSKTASVVLTEPQKIAVTHTIVKNNVTINATGGTPPYKYGYGTNTLDVVNLFEKLPNGSYTFRVRDANGCTEQYPVVINYVGVFDVENKLGFDLYPNPTQGNCTLQLQTPTYENTRLTLTDALGKVVLQENLGTNFLSKTLDLSSLSNGVYYLKLNTPTVQGVKRVVVVK
jgi:subtilisin-like proprotein convertase family protein